jgi:hypothetical protein
VMNDQRITCLWKEGVITASNTAARPSEIKWEVIIGICKKWRSLVTLTRVVSSKLVDDKSLNGLSSRGKSPRTGNGKVDISLSIYLSIYLSICLSIYLSICLKGVCSKEVQRLGRLGR